MTSQKGSWYIIGAFALLKLMIPYLFIHAGFDLHRDEYLYLADSAHLSWGYIEMPPMLAFLGHLSLLAGGTPATVYFWGGFFGAITLLLTGAIVLKLKGNRTAVWITCLAYLCCGFLRMHILFQPNFLDVFFWTLSTYLLVCWLIKPSDKYLYAIGISFGLGMLGKYSMAFYILAFLIALLLTGHSKLIRNKHFWLAMGSGILICSPNIIWQIQHSFPVMHHMDLLTRQQLQYNSRTDFLIGQLLMTLPCFFLWIIGLVFVIRNRKEQKFHAVAWLYAGIIAILLYFNGKAYYAAAIYPSLMAFGGVAVSRISLRKNWRWLPYVLSAWMVLLALLIFPILIPFESPDKLVQFYKRWHLEKSPAFQWEDHQLHPLPQDFADMLGWKEMAQKTARIYNSLPDSVKKQTMVYGDNYGEAGALGFYGRPLGLPEIYSDNATYLFWLPEHFTQRYFLFATADLPDPDDSFFNHWGKREILDSVTTPMAREFGTKIILYSQPDDSARIIAEQHLKEGRERYHLR